MMGHRVKKFLFFLAFLACQPPWTSLLEGKECDCSFLEKSLEEADKRFQRIQDSRETDPQVLFLECLDKTASQPDSLYNYCLDFADMKDRSQVREVHDKARNKIKASVDECKKARGCEEWKGTLIRGCEESAGKQRALCYLEKNSWNDFREKYPREAEDFLRAWKTDAENIKGFLYAKSSVCDEKYEKDVFRRDRCIANFKEKYAIQALLEKSGGPDEPVKGAKEEKKDLAALVLGKWQSQEAGCIIEVTLKNDSPKINCLLGCGEGEEFEWTRGYNFTRKYSKSAKLGAGHFNEKCIFDEYHEKFICDGTVKFVSRYGGGVEAQRLETRTYFRMLE
ncbi:MAG: hypothetical protein HZA01_02610 [Nitrospinae bacterium]|nr:hypothetical protein [Nitrospinota bacterium]